MRVIVKINNVIRNNQKPFILEIRFLFGSHVWLRHSKLRARPASSFGYGVWRELLQGIKSVENLQTNFSRLSFGKVIDSTIKIQSIGKFPLYGEDCQVCKPCLAHCWPKVVLYELELREWALAAGNANSSGKEDAQQDHNIRGGFPKVVLLYAAPLSFTLFITVSFFENSRKDSENTKKDGSFKLIMNKI